MQWQDCAVSMQMCCIYRPVSLESGYAWHFHSNHGQNNICLAMPIFRHPWLRSKQTSVGLTGNNAVPSRSDAPPHISKQAEVNFKVSAIINKSNLFTSGNFASKYTRPNSIKELCNHHTGIQTIINLS